MAVNDECKLKFLDLKAKRSFRYIVFCIEEKIQQVKVDQVGHPDASYEDFTACLPANECRYAVFDFDFTTDENCQKSKIFFIAWYVEWFLQHQNEISREKYLISLPFVFSRRDPKNTKKEKIICCMNGGSINMSRDISF